MEVKSFIKFACAVAMTISVWQVGHAEKIRVALFDPSVSGPFVDEGTKVAVRELIGSTMVNSGVFTILERSLLDNVLKEMKFSNTDAVDESQASELGKLAGANKVVLSVISRAGKKNMLSVKIIDVETGSIERQKAKVVAPEELLDEVEPMVSEMITGVNAPKRPTVKKVPPTETKSEEPSTEGGNLTVKIDRNYLPANAIGKIYYLDKDKKEVFMKLATFEGAKSKFGYRVAIKISYSNPVSPNQFTTGQPEFYVLLGNDASIDNVKLVSLEKSKKDRKYKFAVASAFGVNYCEDFIQMVVTDLGNGLYRIQPAAPLKKGCYGIYYKHGNTDPQMYDFDVQ